MTCRVLKLWGIAAVAVGAFAQTPAEANGWQTDREVIIEWNEILQRNIPASAGLFSFRYYAMMHIAMFDAVNSIEGGYERYHVRVPAHPIASAEAAAAQAAHDVLVALIGPNAAFDTALNDRLAKLQPWRAAAGAHVGAKVAQAVVDWRTGDGTEQPNIAYLPPALPGLWQPTPPTNAPAAGVQFSGVEPFALLTPTQYLPDPPPPLNSAQYANDVNQVKDLGARNSATRTADQTLVAYLIQGVSYGPGPFAVWSQVSREVARSQQLSLLRTARLFALVNVAMHDGLQTSHSSKFVYGLWRPVTAIRRADEDLNDSTMADPNWEPLFFGPAPAVTPAYPSHSSNVACIAWSAARTLQHIARTDNFPFTLTWTGTGANAGITQQRSYASFSAFAEEAGLARVYAGIHFRFELEASRESCEKVGDYVVRHYAGRR
jgi:hypothetical protein